ncbi:hypothetical protein SE17_07020 [Kouleothrix aurantiaca]|uniref:histidine kinase n=1 Tax=Kouleothrix aurantiaca TaxID=186479 RepID=A0A0P9D7P8_9CHLR|nr:hypothetical protein SE17_07020 [Kouleothrix aurantiaca]
MTHGQHTPLEIAGEIRNLLAETSWYIALTSPSGDVVALSNALAGLLHLASGAMIGRNLAEIVPESERGALHQAYTELSPHVPLALRTTLLVLGQIELAADIELQRIEALPGEAVLVAIYPAASPDTPLLPAFNALAPHIQAAQSPDDLFSGCMRVLGPLGLNMWVTLLDSQAAALHTAYISINPQLLSLLAHSAQFDPEQCEIALETPVIGAALAHGQAIAAESMQALIEALLPSRFYGVIAALLRFTGRPSMIAAPILRAGVPGGVLVLWGQALPPAAIPAVESFASQLGAQLSQFALQRHLERHDQLLHALGQIAQATNTMSTREEVLRAVCEQAQQLMRATYVTIAEPEPGEQVLECTMALGDAARWLGARAPYAASVAGQVMLTGAGVLVPVVAQNPAAHDGVRASAVVQSSLAQPLRNQEAIIGVLTVGHKEPNFFGPDDLEYLGRFANYAAVAIVNAGLLATTQAAEEAQRRHQPELTEQLAWSRTLNATSDLDATVEATFHLLDAQNLACMGSMFITDADFGDIRYQAYHGIPPELHEQTRETLRHPALLDALRAGHMHAYGSEIGRHITWQNPELTPFLPQQAIAFPLYTAEQTQGVLIVGRQGDHDYTADERRMLQTIANQLAQAIARIQSHTIIKTAADQYANLYRGAETVRLYLDTLIQHSPMLLLSIRPNMTVHIINPERLAESPHKQRITEGQHLGEVIPSQLHSELFERYRRVRAGQPQYFELDLSSNGDTLQVRLAATLIPSYDEVLVIVQDVTEARHAEAQLRRNEKLAGMGRMLAGAAHELNNPLAAILGLAQLQLLNSTHTSELRDDLGKIEHAALRARAIVQQLLSLARAQRPGAHRVALHPLIDAILQRLALPMAAIKVSVQQTFDEHLPPAAGDPDQLQQALFNIIHNAIQALADKPPGAARELNIRAQLVRQHILLSIADNGAGILPEHQPHIFEPFFTTRIVGQGTGLGLALSHAIILQHSGTIWVHSQPSQGTTFFVQLPVAPHSAPYSGV